MSEHEHALQQTPAAAGETSLSGNDFRQLLLKSVKPANEIARQAVEDSVHTLAAQALEQAIVVSDDVISTVEEMIAAIDRKLTDQINEILHDNTFQQLEGAWRGLHFLVSNTETDDKQKIRVMSIRKDELRKTLKKYKGTAWDQSPLFKKIYEEEYGQFGGEPIGIIVGDYQFDQSGPDVELLAQLAQIGAAAHAPFVAAAAPTALKMESWRELANPRDLAKIMNTPEYGAWRKLRESEDSRYLALAMPRFLARAPYGAHTNPVDDFAFEEQTQGNSANYCWANAAYAMALNMNTSFSLYGWCSRIRGIESGGAVDGLPTHTFPSDDGGFDSQCPTEIAISDRREAELSKLGFLPLIHQKGTDFAAFIGAQSLHKPAEYDDPDATANANLAARIPYMMACNRFAHYLKCIVRDKIGSFKNKDDMKLWLHNWLVNYVDAAPSISSETMKARTPLAAAEINLEENESNPGYYNAKFFLKPHFQLEGLTVSLRLVAQLPSIKK